MNERSARDPRAAAGLRAFFGIARAWGLTAAEQQILLGQPDAARYREWEAAPAVAQVGQETLERLSHVLGIYRGLQTLLPSSAAADDWVKATNAAAPFNGMRAIDVMLGGNVADLSIVRQYLQAQIVG